MHSHWPKESWSVNRATRTVVWAAVDAPMHIGAASERFCRGSSVRKHRLEQSQIRALLSANTPMLAFGILHQYASLLFNPFQPKLATRLNLVMKELPETTKMWVLGGAASGAYKEVGHPNMPLCPACAYQSIR